MICQYCYSAEAANSNGLCDWCNNEDVGWGLVWQVLTALAIFGAIFGLYLLCWSIIPPVG
jgi:hypothetical protein